MAWGFGVGENFIWPEDLKKKAYPKAIKAGKISYVLESLDAAEKFQNGITPPFLPGQMSQTMYDIWDKQATAFIGGDGKKVWGNLTMIHKRADNALKEKDIAKDKESVAALKAIMKSCETHLKDVTPSAYTSKVESMRKAFKAKMKEMANKLLGPSVAGWKSASSKGHPQIPEAQKLLVQAKDQDGETQAKTLGVFATAMTKAARIMTQCIANVAKAKQQGTLVPGLDENDYSAMASLMKVLLPYGNASGDWTKGDLKTAALGFKTVNAHTQMFDQIGKKMAM